jgi:hypothetical protein
LYFWVYRRVIISRVVAVDAAVAACLVLGRRLNHTLAVVAGRRDTCERLCALGLESRLVAERVDQATDGLTYLDEFIRGLLVLLGHGRRRRLGEHAHGREESERDADTDGNVESDLAALIGRRYGTGAVSTEGDPVGCWRETNVSI